MTDDGHGAPMKFSQSRNYSLVVGVAAVAVQLDKIREQQSYKIQRVRTLLVTRDLRSLPRPQVRVKLAPQFLDIFFQAVDFFLAAALFRTVGGRWSGFVLVFCSHSGTIRTACLPQI